MRSGLMRRRRLMLTRRARGNMVCGRSLVRRIVCVSRLLQCSRVLHRSRMRNVPCLRSLPVRVVAGSRDIRRSARLLVIVRRSWNVL